MVGIDVVVGCVNVVGLGCDVVVVVCFGVV